MKDVAVLSNCTAPGLAQAVSALLPACRVICFDLSTVDIGAFQARAREELPRFDLVIADRYGADFGVLSGARLPEITRRVLFLPPVVFWGFHPDITYLPVACRGIHSPLREYHSRIAIAGFLSNRSVAETTALFNPLVFAMLGYRDAFPRELAALSAMYREEGIDIDPDLPRWQATGCFMHSPNHPTPAVLGDIARAALRSAGITVDEGADCAALPDTLAFHPSFPVYPDLAAGIGLAGSFDFRMRGHPGAGGALLSLDAFLRGSFARYADAPREALREGLGVDRALSLLGG